MYSRSSHSRAVSRQLGIENRSLGVNLVDVLAGRVDASEALVAGVHGVDVIASGRDLAGIELSLVSEFGREHFLREALEPVISDYDHVVIDTPPNLGLLTVNAIGLADLVAAPVSAEDEESLHRIHELRRTVGRLADRLEPAAAPHHGDLDALGAVSDQQSCRRAALSEHDFQLAHRIPSRPALFAAAAAQTCLARGPQP